MKSKEESSTRVEREELVAIESCSRSRLGRRRDKRGGNSS